MPASPARSEGDRTATRLSRLRQLTAKRQVRDVLGALEAEWKDGRAPSRIYIRRAFARHDRPLNGAFSDRRLPPPELRPPSTRIIAPRGVTQQTYLTVLFVAQCHVERGHRFRSERRVAPHPNDSSGLAPWSDLIAAPADHRSGTKTYLSSEDNRLRQVKHALSRLASDDMRLVEFPNASARSGKFEGFRPLDESGRLNSASRVPYIVPRDSEDVFGVPSTFWLKGWHLALTNSEIALLFALWARRDGAGKWPNGVLVRLDGESRIRRYGLSPDAYATHKMLDAVDLVEVVADPNRRPDGTYEDFGEGETPIPHELRIDEDGFNRSAVETVMATLKGLKH